MTTYMPVNGYLLFYSFPFLHSMFCLLPFPYTHTCTLNRRQSNGNCMTDQMEANSTHFQSCISLFANDHYIPGYTSNDTLHNFCDNNCSNELLDVITRLKRDCGGVDNLVSDELKTQLQTRK